jgi:hypothetical protein
MAIGISVSPGIIAGSKCNFNAFDTGVFIIFYEKHHTLLSNIEKHHTLFSNILAEINLYFLYLTLFYI